MIATFFTCVLPIVASLDADVSARVQVAPGIAVSLHSDSYYDQREKDRQNHLAQVQSERDEDRRNQESFDREQPREKGSFYFWRDNREQHERKQREMVEANRRREQARANREQAFRDEENRDKDERNHRQDERNHEKDDRQHQEEDRRHGDDDRR